MKTPPDSTRGSTAQLVVGREGWEMNNQERPAAPLTDSNCAFIYVCLNCVCASPKLGGFLLKSQEESEHSIWSTEWFIMILLNTNNKLFLICAQTVTKIIEVQAITNHKQDRCARFFSNWTCSAAVFTTKHKESIFSLTSWSRNDPCPGKVSPQPNCKDLWRPWNTWRADTPLLR